MRRIRAITVLLFVVVAAFYGVSTYFSRYVEDRTAPVLLSDSQVLELSVKDGEDALLSGLTATDDRDGDITHQIFVEHSSGLIDRNTIKVTYAVFDSSDNLAKLSRYVRYVDYATPRFSLTKPLVFKAMETVTFLDRLSVTDCLEGDISHKIRLDDSQMSTYSPGIYPITVQASNALGDTVILPLSVIIESQRMNVPEISLTDYLIYIDRGTRLRPREYLKSVYDPALDDLTIEDVDPDASEPDNMSDRETPTPKLSDVEVDATGVNVQVPGVYEIKYTYRGQEADGTVILTVVVQE